MTLADLITTNINTVILAVGVVGITVKTVMEAKGWTKSAQILRRENADLTDRNRTLEADKVERLAEELKLRARIESLELKVRDLESRDQAAVLAAITAHEQGAIQRYEHTKDGDEHRHTEHIERLDRIVNALEGRSE